MEPVDEWQEAYTTSWSRREYGPDHLMWGPVASSKEEARELLYHDLQGGYGNGIYRHRQVVTVYTDWEVC